MAEQEDGSSWPLVQTVGSLSAVRSLGLECIAGSSGLDRALAWAHVSELEDPSPWLDGGELVLTAGIGLPKAAPQQVAYLTRLRDRGAAALAVGEQSSPGRRKPSRAMREHADRIGFPLLRVADNVPFISIVKTVADGNDQATRRRLTPYLHVLDAMRLRSETAEGPAAMFRRLEQICGYHLVVASPAGLDLLGRQVLPEPVRSALAATRATPLIPQGFVVALHHGGRLCAYLVALSQDGVEGAGLTIVRHIAVLAEFELGEELRVRQARRAEGAVLFGDLLRSRVPEQAAEQLAAAGIDVGDGVVVVAVRDDRGGEVDATEVHHWLADRRIAHLVLEAEGLYLLVGDGALPSTVASELRARVGVSRARHALSEVVLARREAAWALESAAVTSAGRPVLFGGDPSDYWLPSDLDLLRGLVDSVLGPVIEYDRAHGTELITSLTTYFLHDRRLLAASRTMFVHKHTLAYRLRRIEALTGRVLANVADNAQMWLALRGLAVLGSHDGTDPR